MGRLSEASLLLCTLLCWLCRSKARTLQLLGSLHPLVSAVCCRVGEDSTAGVQHLC
jgi:hypothetical protein